MKKCTTCNKTKSISEFTPRKERPGQVTIDCKDCRAINAKKYREENHSKVRKTERTYRSKNIEILNEKNKLRLRKERKENPNRDRAYKLKYTYGITMEQFDELLKKQKNKCAICQTNNPAGRGFCVDHCHKTKKIRGILCHHCNTALGGFKDSPELLEKAIKYLKI